MDRPESLSELNQILTAEKLANFREFCDSGHPASIAGIISDLEPRDAWKVLKQAPGERRAEIFSHLEESLQIAIADTLTKPELAELFYYIPADDRADLFAELPEMLQTTILSALAYAEREDIRRLCSYPEGSAGSVMTSEYASLRPEMTAAEAIDQLRVEAPNRETIYYSYVIDDTRHLLGLVSLRDLIMANPKMPVCEFMNREVIFAKVSDDQEGAARKIQKFDLIALPVVDDNGALVGIITHDDAFDVITQEQTEDIEKLMAIGGAHEVGAYLSTPTWTHFKNRAVWIACLAALGLVSGMVIHRFEDTLGQLLILALYMPMMADTGGNTGSQSATIVIRALALGEIGVRDVFKVVYKELRISLMMASMLGLLAWGRVMLLSQRVHNTGGFALSQIGLAIALALGIQVVTSTLFGALLPLAAARLKLDPAVVASPALTTVVDITGLLIYFTTVRWVLGF